MTPLNLITENKLLDLAIRNNSRVLFLNLFNGVFIFLLLASTIIFSTSIYGEEDAVNLEQMLLMPGELTQAHAKIEGQCSLCHGKFDKKNQTPLCLDCHKILRQEIDLKTGFHGKLEESLSTKCINCHSEHLGRQFDISGLDKEMFDHAQTDFALKDSHQILECESCHSGVSATTKKSLKGILELPVEHGFRFAEYSCSSCHEDYHQAELGKKCEKCHSEKSWTENKFDHSKTSFKLNGSHQTVSCNRCHINQSFKKIDTGCQSCHLAQEPHLGVFGTQCEDCHSAQSWTKSIFDHTQDTRFQLQGNHQKIKCVECHAKEIKPQTACIGCHKKEDVHQGSNGNECQKCHTPAQWKQTNFVHGIETGFALTGAHMQTECESCHVPGDSRNGLGLVRACVDCHQAIDPHLGKLGKECKACHATQSWQQNISFNHDFADFALSGSHQYLVCEACHASPVFSEQSSSCFSCHNNDDVHQRSLGEQCDSCHNTSIWSQWQFNHEQQTRYPLTGSHLNLKCNLCHVKELSNSLKPSQDCFACHRDDDIHSGGFGVDCQQCHSTERFDVLN